MDCFNDFCLNCDKQCGESPYCSQACRLADLEKGNTSAPTSPSTSMSGKNSAAWSTSAYGYSNNLVRSYTYDVSSKTSNTRPAVTSSSTSNGRLTPSSSRTSLASTSSSGAAGLTEQARLELRDYFSSFDQTRAAKRRSSVR